MRANHYIHFAGFEIGENFLLLRGTAEATEHFDANGKRGETLFESFEMLERQDSRRRKNRNLLAVGYRLEYRTHGNFRFAVAHVTAEQPVHRRGPLHIALDVGNGGVLVRRFLKFERVFKFALEIAVGGKSKALRRFARSVESQKL